MKLSDAIKPISYLKAHASELIREIAKNRETLIITQNGEAKVVVQDIHLYEQNQESLALLKILAQSTSSIQKGEYSTLKSSFSRLEKRISLKARNEV